MIPTLLMYGLPFLGIALTAYLTYRVGKAQAAAQHAQAFAEQTEVAVNALTNTVEAVSKDNGDLRERLAKLEGQQEISTLYETMLVNHINERKPPPPPPRPTSVSPLL